MFVEPQPGSGFERVSGLVWLSTTLRRVFRRDAPGTNDAPDDRAPNRPDAPR